MRTFSRRGFSVPLLLALVATTAIAWAYRGDKVSRHQNATANTIRRLGAAVMYDDQQRRQHTSPQVFGAEATIGEGQL